MNRMGVPLLRILERVQYNELLHSRKFCSLNYNDIEICFILLQLQEFPMDVSQLKL